MRPVREGTRWQAYTTTVVVLAEVEAEDGHKWVYYRDEKGDPPREYSCYKESFLLRYSPLPE